MRNAANPNKVCGRSSATGGHASRAGGTGKPTNKPRSAVIRRKGYQKPGVVCEVDVAHRPTDREGPPRWWLLWNGTGEAADPAVFPIWYLGQRHRRLSPDLASGSEKTLPDIAAPIGPRAPSPRSPRRPSAPRRRLLFVHADKRIGFCPGLVTWVASLAGKSPTLDLALHRGLSIHFGDIV